MGRAIVEHDTVADQRHTKRLPQRREIHRLIFTDDRRFLLHAPGPLRSLTGVRVAETDAAEPEVVNRVRFADGSASLRGAECDASMLFEMLVAEDAEVVARYTDDFYAGEPAVTRRSVRNEHGPSGSVWYVGTQLAQPGVDGIVRSALDRHGLIGPYANNAGLEHAVRIAPDGRRVEFLLHHGSEPAEISLHADGIDLLAGGRLERGSVVILRPADVLVLDTTASQ